MTLEEFIYQGANTSGISNVSTRGQPIISTFCKKDIKESIKRQLVRILVLSNFLKRTMLMVDM